MDLILTGALVYYRYWSFSDETFRKSGFEMTHVRGTPGKPPTYSVRVSLGEHLIHAAIEWSCTSQSL